MLFSGFHKGTGLLSLARSLSLSLPAPTHTQGNKPPDTRNTNPKRKLLPMTWQRQLVLTERDPWQRRLVPTNEILP